MANKVTELSSISSHASRRRWSFTNRERWLAWALVLPAFVVVFALTATTGRPQYLASNRHVLSAGVDLLELRWDEDARTLKGRSAVVAGSTYSVYVYAPPDYGIKSAPGACSDATAGPECTRVSYQIGNATELAWQLSF